MSFFFSLLIELIMLWPYITKLTTSDLFNEPQGGYEPNCHQKQAELANFISGNAKFFNNNLSSGDINESSFF